MQYLQNREDICMYKWKEVNELSVHTTVGGTFYATVRLHDFVQYKDATLSPGFHNKILYYSTWIAHTVARARHEKYV